MDTMAICPAGGLMTDKIRWDLFVQTGHRQRTEWASPSDRKDKKIYTSLNKNKVKKRICSEKSHRFTVHT